MTDSSTTSEYVYTKEDIPIYNDITDIVGGIINYEEINKTGGLFNSFDTRGGGKTKKSKAKSAKTVKPTKSAKTTKSTKTSKTTKSTKITKPTKAVKASINDVKIPKKIMDDLYNNINKMYKVYNKKIKKTGMKGGGNILDSYFNTTDLALGSFIPTAYDPNTFSRSSLLSNMGASLK